MTSDPKITIADIDITLEIIEYCETCIRRCEHSIKPCFVSVSQLFNDISKYLDNGIINESDIICNYEDYNAVRKEIIALVCKCIKIKPVFIELYEKYCFKGIELVNVKKERQEPYIAHEPKIIRFLKIYTIPAKNNIISVDVLYAIFREWWDYQTGGKPPTTRKRFIPIVNSYFNCKPEITNIAIAWIGHSLKQ